MTAPGETGGPDHERSGPPQTDAWAGEAASAGATPGAPSRRGGFALLAAGGVALGMHLVVGAAYALTLVLAPPWVSVVVAVWWLALLLSGLLLLARRNLLVLAVPLVAIASWAGLICAGRAWFGWH